LLPERSPGRDLSQAYPIREYLTEVRVTQDSPLIGQTVTQSHLGEKYDLNVIHILSPDEQSVFATPYRRLKAGDILLVEAAPGELLKIGRAEGLAPVPGWNIEELTRELPSGTPELVEITLAPRSRLNGQTLKEIDFRARYGLNVMAIRHQGQSLVSKLADIRLVFGDALLVQGPPAKISLLRHDDNFLVLDTPPVEIRRTYKAPLAVGILAATLTVATLGWLPISAAILIGALLMVLTGTLSMDEAYGAIDWKSVFLIAGMLPLGVAMEKTGTAALLANRIVEVIGGWGPLVVMVGIFLLTALLTEVISNAAATVLVVPIAIDVARSLEVNLEPFVMAVVLAASTSFLMPIGHQVNVLIFGPGGYKFLDYARVGLGLNLIILILVALFLPLIWPL
jgi:di/tricarboxylate transporter